MCVMLKVLTWLGDRGQMELTCFRPNTGKCGLLSEYNGKEKGLPVDTPMADSCLVVKLKEQ